MGLFMRKITGAGIILALTGYTVVIVAFTHPSELRHIPKRSAEMIRYMMK